MPAVKDYYKILGISEGATADEIKRAYRKLAREHHPDRNPGNAQAEERFKEVQEAHSVLTDAEKRKQYDRMRKHPFGGANGGFRGTPEEVFGNVGGFEDIFGTGAGQGGIGDLFSRVFRGAEATPPPGQRTRSGMRGRGDISTTLRLSFDQALQGGKTEVRLPDGKAVRLNIPRGVEPGFKIRLKGRGESAGRAGPRGDLYVTFEIDPHPVFRRTGTDVSMDVEINSFEALLGTTRSVENPYGTRVKVTIPEGTQPGDRLRLKGMGVQTDKGSGDLYVVISVKTPRGLTPEQKNVIREAANKAGLLPGGR